MKRKLLAALLSFCLLAGMLPLSSAFASASLLNDTGMVCEQTENCTLQAGHEGDCVLPIKNYDAPDMEPCSLAEGCTLEAGHVGNCVFAVAANAPAPQADSTVAKVDGMEYDTLAEAVDAIAGNMEKKGTVEIVSDIKLPEPITISDGVEITLTDDGNAHTVTMTSNYNNSSKAAFVIEQGGSLIIDASSLTITRQEYGSGASGLIACHGTLRLEDGTLDFGGHKLTWSLSGSELARGIVEVCGQGAVFTMNGGTIQNAETTNNTGGVRVCCNGKYFMENGVISGINGGRLLNTGAVLVYSNGSNATGNPIFEMNGGYIENNIGYRGAGVYVVGVEYTYRATMVMNGGYIRDNTCTGWANRPDDTFQAAGTGIYIQGNASVTMNGGFIQNNTVNGGVGGAVATSDGYYDTFPGGPNSSGAWTIEDYSYYYPASFTMNGGTISGNQVTMGDVGGDGGCGGGIYAASNKVTLKGGFIENNEAERQGGGVYVGSIPYELKIYDAVVTGNEASILGGGVWACPTGDTEFFVTNGVGIYNNISKGAGDDVVSVKTSGQNYVLTLADRILGGGQVLWHKDGGLAADGGILGLPDGSPRYDPSGDAKPITQIQNSTEPYALKAVVSDEAKALAEDSATLFIRSNKSARGGGIGTNGGIVMGEKDNEYTLKVTKDLGETDESLKKPVTVYLKVGETVLDPVTLNAENGWTAEFTQLPDPATLTEGLSYAVVENPVPEYFEPSYSEVLIDETTRTITIGITNTYQPNGNLIVSKTVSGNAADETKEFNFTVTLDDTSITGKYGDMEFVDGMANFTLKHSESLTATCLPAGVGYTVAESDSEGYTVTATGATGTIADRQTFEAKFNNHKDKPEEPTEPDNPSEPDEPSTPGGPDDNPNIPQTGDQSNMALYGLLLLLSGAGVTGGVIYNLRRVRGK